VIHNSYRLLCLFLLICILFNILFFKNFNSGLPVAFIFSFLFLTFIDNYIFKRHQSVLEALKPVLLINIFLLYIFYISRYELHLPINYFRVGFTYDNFWDFYYQLLNAANASYKTVSSGYLPLSQAISKFFALICDWNSSIPNLSRKTISVYLIFYVVCISPILLFLKDFKKEVDSYYYILFFLILSSYPFIFCFERGNFVLISFFFLTLSLYFFSRKNHIAAILFLSFFFSLKVFNLFCYLFY